MLLDELAWPCVFSSCNNFSLIPGNYLESFHKTVLGTIIRCIVVEKRLANLFRYATRLPVILLCTDVQSPLTNGEYISKLAYTKLWFTLVVG